ncbi:MAG TPA: HTTM domain-containing protein, partial [Chitinophagaceae bacterium]|nr:HTTM domain-containing protein [Chitinophagaceae bacterium]
AIFFPGIGMFPYVMIVCSTIFFSARFHQRLLSCLPLYTRLPDHHPATGQAYQYRFHSVMQMMLIVYASVQLIIPIRFMLYPGHLFWHEEGYRFSWRVMLMEKSGATFFTVKDKTHQVVQQVNNAEFLTPLQEKMMSTQPDLILKYAHYLANQFAQRGIAQPEVYAEVYVALNGQRSRLFIDSTVNLAAQSLSWRHYNWVLPYKE